MVRNIFWYCFVTSYLYISYSYPSRLCTKCWFTFSSRNRIHQRIRRWHPGLERDWGEHSTVWLHSYCVWHCWRQGGRQNGVWTLEGYWRASEAILLKINRNQKDGDVFTLIFIANKNFSVILTNYLWQNLENDDGYIWNVLAYRSEVRSSNPWKGGIWMYRSFKSWVSGGSKTSITPKEALNNSKGEVGLKGQNNV